MMFTKARQWKQMAAAMAAMMFLPWMTGCGVGNSVSGGVNTFSNEATITGKIHGGQYPVAFATVKLYTMGTSGYGSSGTLLATTTTTYPDGAFTFVKSSTNGVSSGSGNTWACPATTDDPQLYIVSSGGNSQGTNLNDAADTNSAITMVAALGPCSQVSNSTFVIVDEMSTAAAAFALAPYINSSTEAIGTNGANVPTSTPQAAVGLNNAVAGIANLKATSTAYTATPTGSTTSVTVTATPEANKMNTIADILAACVNTTTQSSANCTQLFNAALSTAGTKPSDVFQAAYNMATNPTDAGTVTSCGTPTTNLGCLYALASSTGPFQNTLATAPTDWTVGITYSATGSCANNGFGGALFFDSPTKEAIDANGNIWIVNGSISKASIVEMSPIGQPLSCVIPSVASGTAQTYGSGITIDPTGNVWAIFGHGTFTNSVVELPVGATLPTSYSPAAEPFGIAADGDGDIFYSTTAASGTMYEFVAPTTGGAASPTGAVIATPQLYSANNTTTITVNTISPDSTGRVFVDSASIASMIANFPLTATITSYSVSGGVATFTAANTFTAGQTVTISGLSTANGTQFNGRFLVASATASSFTVSTTAGTIASTTDSGSVRATGPSSYTTQLVAEYTSSYGAAIDSTNHVYTGSACCSNGSTGWGKLGRFTPSATSSGSSTGTTSTTQYLGGMNGTRSVAVDGNSRIWMGQYWWESAGTPNAYGLVEMGFSGTSTFTAYSPTGAGSCAGTAAGGCATGGGFQKAGFLAITDVEIDPSGNVWTVSTGPNAGTTTSGTISPYTSGTQPLGLVVVEVVGAAAPVVTPMSVATKNGTLATKP